MGISSFGTSFAKIVNCDLKNNKRKKGGKMKLFRKFLFISVFALGLILELIAGDGRIIEVKQYTVPPTIKVYVKVSDRRDYVGLTIDSNGDGKFTEVDINFKAQRVSGSSNVAKFTFSNIYNFQAYYGNDFIVSLWDEKVEDCGCSWCDKYGYHLEGRLDRFYGTVKENPFEF